MALQNKKSLGQHWLKDREVLGAIADSAGILVTDTVLEVGPGLGTLTSELLRRAKQVVAVEFDADLARKLPGQFPGKNLEVINQDILTYDLSTLPTGYKVVANVPYYITSKIVERLLTTANKPSRMVLLVQKEVAERLAAGAGSMSVLAVSAQVYARVELGALVDREYFEPAPKVDSQVVVFDVFDKPLVGGSDERAFFKLVKLGFLGKRKKLVNTLASGTGLAKGDLAVILGEMGISPDSRAQDLAVQDWLNLLEKLS